MICRKCGASLLDDVRFCSQCGVKIEEMKKREGQEKPINKDVSYLPDEFDKKSSNKIIVPHGLDRHEEATQEPLLSPMGLFSTYGRRNRIDTLKMIFLQVVVCFVVMFIIPIISPFLSFWFEITNAFKRLQDLDKSKVWKIGFVVLYIMVRVPIAFFVITELFNTKSRVGVSSYANVYMVLLLVYLLFYLYLLIAPGTQGANRYGRSPEELKQVSK